MHVRRVRMHVRRGWKEGKAERDGGGTETKKPLPNKNGGSVKTGVTTLGIPGTAQQKWEGQFEREKGIEPKEGSRGPGFWACRLG
jgi:hypothetical protein